MKVDPNNKTFSAFFTLFEEKAAVPTRRLEDIGQEERVLADKRPLALLDAQINVMKRRAEEARVKGNEAAAARLEERAEELVTEKNALTESRNAKTAALSRERGECEKQVEAAANNALRELFPSTAERTQEMWINAELVTEAVEDGLKMFSAKTGVRIPSIYLEMLISPKSGPKRDIGDRMSRRIR